MACHRAVLAILLCHVQFPRMLSLSLRFGPLRNHLSFLDNWWIVSQMNVTGAGLFPSSEMCAAVWWSLTGSCCVSDNTLAFNLTKSFSVRRGGPPLAATLYPGMFWLGKNTGWMWVLRWESLSVRWCGWKVVGCAFETTRSCGLIISLEGCLAAVLFVREWSYQSTVFGRAETAVIMEALSEHLLWTIFVLVDDQI